MLTPEPLEDFAQEIHKRLLSKDDPTAPSKLAYAYLGTLVRRLRRRFGGIRDETFFYDAATDAILNYAENPSSFDPSRSDLLTYLTNSAMGDLKNALAKEKRRGQSQGKVTEQLSLNLDCSQDSINVPLVEDDSVQKLMERVFQEFPDPCDRQLLPLILDGERKTSAFVEILGIQDHSKEDQRLIVKRHKDRIKVRLKRLGVKINE